MATRADEIAAILKRQIEDFDQGVTETNVGTVIEASDGIARIHGLQRCVSSELIEFASGVRGLALNLEEETVGAIVLGDHTEIAEGDEVRHRAVRAPVPHRGGSPQRSDSRISRAAERRSRCSSSR